MLAGCADMLMAGDRCYRAHRHIVGTGLHPVCGAGHLSSAGSEIWHQLHKESKN